MNCSDALLDGVAKYAFEIGLNPLEKRKPHKFQINKGTPHRIGGAIAQCDFKLTSTCKIYSHNPRALGYPKWSPLQ